jgi:hypothetical protein
MPENKENIFSRIREKVFQNQVLEQKRTVPEVSRAWLKARRQTPARLLLVRRAPDQCGVKPVTL